MVYLFIGQDGPPKETKLGSLKEEFFPLKDMGNFNFDVLYADELDLIKFQETLLRLPVKAKKRLVWLRKSHRLKDNIKEYLTEYVKKPLPHVLLILDMEHFDRRDEFQSEIARYTRVFRFQEKEAVDSFGLCDEIDNKRIKSSLKVLHKLILNGTKPEAILGALRYDWEKSYLPPHEKRRRLRALLNCDIDIKTGRLKPVFALERLIINLCCSVPPKVF